MLKKQLIQSILMSAAVAAKKTTIGGQALIEGLLMIGPDKRAMAVRRPDGHIMLEQLAPIKITRTSNWLFIRGSVRLFRQLVSGTKALLRSAELAEDETPSSEPEIEKQQETVSTLKNEPATFFKRIMLAVDQWMENHMNAVLYITAVFGILFSVVLFILLPNLLTSLLRQFTPLGLMTGRGTTILLNLIEGLIRITIFISYLALTSKLKDIQRVWMYHGAEHKTIACYEDGKPLTVANVKNYSRYHPRCGTAFLFIVILVSIVVFSFFGWWSRWINLLIRFALVPLVAGIAYEIIRLAGRYNNRLTRAISAPGLWLQRFTTVEPEDNMLEVSIAAMEAVQPDAANSDQW